LKMENGKWKMENGKCHFTKLGRQRFFVKQRGD